MKLFPNRKKTYSMFVRGVAGLLLPSVLHLLLPELAFAQTFKSFEQGRDDLGRYFDRATRMEDEEDWQSYVDLGIATERVEWEKESYDALSDALREIDRSGGDEETREAEAAEAIARYEAAGEAWDQAAEKAKESERGEFLARQAAVSVAERSIDEYEAIIASAEAAVAAIAGADMSDWEAAIAVDHATLVAAFNKELEDELKRARDENDELEGDALAAFDLELERIENEIKAEFTTRDRFYITKSRNRYVAVLRGDDLNARLASEESGAEATTAAIIGATKDQLAADVSDMLQTAIDEVDDLTEGAGAAEFDAAGLNWEARMEAVIDAGLNAWQQAEEDLYAKRLAWQHQAETDREAGMEIWRQQHEDLKKERDLWLDDVQEQIQTGRDQWQAKIAEFREGRQQSEEELAAYIQAERERWDAASRELGDIVNGGGAALLETRDAYNYYNDLLGAIGPPGNQDPRDAQVYQFYQQQRDYMSQAVARFQGILGTAEGVLQASMHSTEDHSGLLNDVRLFAGDLPETVAGLKEDGYAGLLQKEMENRGEEFVLYRRDLEGLIERNAIFAERASELDDSTDFAYDDAETLEDLGRLINALDRKYDDQRGELTAIFNEDRSDLADDDARLAAVQDAIDDWVTLSTDSDKRLKQETIAYFNEGLGGTYLTGNEGDPYLMTRAEYEWEVLRRERNYLATRLRRAEEVKRYADLAYQHEAELEMAAITAERATIAEAHRDLKELRYLIIKGDPALELDANVYTDPAVRDSELDRLLRERGVDRTALAARKTGLATELGLFADIADIADPGGAADRDDIDELVTDIDAYLVGAFPDSAADFEEQRAGHPAGLVRAKLIAYRDRIDAGAADAELADRWSALGAAASALSGEIQNLMDDYAFDDLDQAIEDIRDRIETENLTAIRGDLEEIKGRIEANAELLAEAKVELDLAKDTYKQARIDWDIIRAGNSEDLIRLDLLNTAGALASVTHRMAKIEDIEGFNGVYDAATEQRLRYLDAISENVRATEDIANSEAAYHMVQGLETARERERELDALVSGIDLANQDPVALADLFIGAESKIIAINTGEVHLDSHPGARQAFETLKFTRGELDRLQTELTEAQALPFDAEDKALKVAIARANLSMARDTVYRQSELLMNAVRGEGEARTRALHHYLGTKDADGDPLADPESIMEDAREAGEALYRESFAVSEMAALHIRDFLEANHEDGGRKRDFAELLELANTSIAALPRAFDDAGDGYGSRPHSHDAGRAVWNITRNWLFENQALIDWAGEEPDENSLDPRSVDDKWEQVLKTVRGMADDSGVYDDFAAGVPDSASDAWVTGFVNERDALRAKLKAALAGPDSGLASAYSGLAAREKELVFRYAGAPDPADSRALRTVLDVAEQSAGLEAAAATREYAAFYRQERLFELQGDLADIEEDLAVDRGRLNALVSEKAEHETFKKYLEDQADPGEASRIGELGARIAELETIIAGMRPGIEAREADYRRKAAMAREAAGEGGSVPLLALANRELYLNAAASGMLQQTLAYMQPEMAEQAEEEFETTTSDRVKGIIGFYETERDGEIRRDGAGVPIVSQEFIDAGINDPAADLSELLAGDQRGDDLYEWAERLSTAAADPVRVAELGPEVLGAVQGLEAAIRSYLTARELIDRRYQKVEEIQTDAHAMQSASRGRLDKLTLLAELELTLQSTIQSAAGSGADPGPPLSPSMAGRTPGLPVHVVDAALVFLEDPENARKLRMFRGYDQHGAADGIADPALQAKADELIRLAARLREARLDRRILEAAGQYAEYQNSYAALLYDDRGTLPPERQEFIDALEAFDATDVESDLAAIPVEADHPAATRTALQQWVAAAEPSETYFRSAIVGVLTASAQEGQALKDEAIKAVEDMAAAIDSRLSAHFDRAERLAHRDGALKVTTSVEDLMQAYAVRADTAANGLQPTVDGIDELSDVDPARDLLRDKLEELAGKDAGEDEAALLSIRQALEKIIEDAPDTLALKTNVSQYLTDLENPDASDVAALTDDLYLSSLRGAIGGFNLSADYEALDYPEELRELLLTRGYQRAEARYREYLRQRTSSLEDQADSAVLDLTGINGTFATSILVRDFEDWRAGATGADAFIAARRADGELVALDDFLSGYFRERNTNPGLLPDGARALGERIMLEQYQRLQAEIGGSGIAAVDEDAYFDDLRDYILLLKAKDFIDRGGVTLSGASVGERSDNFESDFQTLLNDPALALGGKTLGARTIGQADRDRFRAAVFAYLEEAPPLEGFLPPVLGEAELEGRLDEPPRAADDYLPDDLKAIAGYANYDYRARAGAISTRTATALARMEVLEAAASEDFSVYMTDAELSAIIDRAGATGTSSDWSGLGGAARAEIVSSLRARNTLGIAGNPGSGEEAAAVLRQNRVLAYLYPTTAEQKAAEEFLTSQGDLPGEIENQFFERLALRHSDLREAAKEQRGHFLRALIARENGTTTAYYDALTPELRDELDVLHQELFDGGDDSLSAEQIEALTNHPDEYRRIFDLRSGQELAASGLFESAEQTILIAVTRADDEAARAALRDQGNRTLLTRALLETVHVKAGQRATLSGEAAGLLAAVPELAAIVDAAADELDGSRRQLFEREYVLINRFYDHFSESAAERREIGALLDDPALIDADLTLRQDYEITRDALLLDREEAELAAALMSAAEDHSRGFSELQRDYARDADRADELLKFAIQRGDDYKTSRFSNYRTYVGAERYYQQQEDFARTEKNGGALYMESMSIASVENLFNGGDWENTLKSDSWNTKVKDVTDEDGEPLQLRAVRAVKSIGERTLGNSDAEQQAEMHETYFENLANNYLEATSQLNAALNAVWAGAAMADKRESLGRDEIKDVVRAHYDPEASGPQELTAIQNLRTNAVARQTEHSQAAVTEYAEGIQSALAIKAEQGETFAGSGRRKQIAGMSLTAFLEARFNEVAQALDDAEEDHTGYADIAAELRTEFGDRNRDLADSLSDMAGYWRDFEAANSEYEERAQVQEYAETPYLFASEKDADDRESDLMAEYRGDAEQEYERALAAYEDAQSRLKEKSYEVQTQDNLEEFNDILTRLDAGETLTDLNTTEIDRLLELRNKTYNDYETLTTDEQNELSDLEQREMYMRYQDVIDTRADHIKHTMRMIRVHKASEIVQAEIMRLRAVADEKQKQFEQELGSTYGNFSDAGQVAARDGVYMRLQGRVEAGQSFFTEFRAWYYGSTDFVGQAASDMADNSLHQNVVSDTGSSDTAVGAATLVGGPAAGYAVANQNQGPDNPWANLRIPTYTTNQLMEGLQGLLDKEQIGSVDRGMIGAWMNAGGNMAAFSGFAGMYFGALTAIGVQDKAELKYHVMKSIWGGLAMSPIGGGAARAKINAAQFEWHITRLFAINTYRRAQSAASKASTQRVMGLQKEYQDSLAKLYYFTRIPDLATFKDRLIQYGAQNQDDDSSEALYQILENEEELGQIVNDLRYVMDDTSGYVNSDGASYDPDAEETDNTLNVSSKLDKADYRDSFGRKYDPATITTGQPGPLKAGYYRAGDGSLYTRIVVANPNGSTYYAYAKIKNDDEKEDVYDMGKVLQMMADHGQLLRDERKARYLVASETAAAPTGDRAFLMTERDQTFQSLFDTAAGHRIGGREFTGYRMTYEDYNANSTEVATSELNQRTQLQLKDWQLKEAELMDRYNAWEGRVGTILERGRKSWAASEDRFLQEWRQWEKEYDKKIAEGQKKWADQVAKHIKERDDWELETRQKASETTIEQVLADQVNQMNANLAASASLIGVDIDAINLTEAINAAKEQLAQEMPTGRERLIAINKNIKKFNAKLSLAQMSGADFLNDALSVGDDFKTEMRDHQKRMKVMANVKIYEQYRQMARKFEEMIDVQNQAIEDQTSQAAFAAGYARMGSIYARQDEGGNRGVVHAYKWFDVRAVLAAEMAAMGLADMSQAETLKMLETKSEVEVDAYFYTQKLAVQVAIEKIQGKPGARGSSQNANEIGLFNAWVGDPGGGRSRQIQEKAGMNGWADENMDQRNQLIEINTAGFGELGARGKRPGGAPLGFYPELEWSEKYMARARANEIKGTDPFSATWNKLNPLEMQERVEVGDRYHGYDRGKLIEAQGAGVAKVIGKVVGGVLIAVGTVVFIVGAVAATLGNGAVPGVSAAAGAGLMWAGGGIVAGGTAMVAAANATEVNMESGEFHTKWSDQAAVATGTDLALGIVSGVATVATAGASAFATSGVSGMVSAGAAEIGKTFAAQGMMGAAYGAMGKVGTLTNTGIQSTGSLITGSAKYHRGKFQGFDINNDPHLLAKTAIGGVMGAVPYLPSAQMFSEYASQQILGAKRAGEYQQSLRRNDSSVLFGAIAGGVTSSVFGARNMRGEKVGFWGGVGNSLMGSFGVNAALSTYDAIDLAMAPELPEGMTEKQALAEAHRAAKEGRKNEAVNLLRSAGIPRRRVDDYLFLMDQAEVQLNQKAHANYMGKPLGELDATNEVVAMLRAEGKGTKFDLVRAKMQEKQRDLGRKLTREEMIDVAVTEFDADPMSHGSKKFQQSYNAIRREHANWKAPTRQTAAPAWHAPMALPQSNSGGDYRFIRDVVIKKGFGWVKENAGVDIQTGSQEYYESSPRLQNFDIATTNQATNAYRRVQQIPGQVAGAIQNFPENVIGPSYNTQDILMMSQAERDAAPWHNFANTRYSTEMRKFQIGYYNMSPWEKTKNFIRGMVNPSEDQRRFGAENRVAFMRDLGVHVSQEGARSYVDKLFTVSDKLTDKEQVEDTVQAIDSGDPSAIAPSLLMLGLTMYIDKIPGVKPARKWLGDTAWPAIKRGLNRLTDWGGRKLSGIREALGDQLKRFQKTDLDQERYLNDGVQEMRDIPFRPLAKAQRASLQRKLDNRTLTASEWKQMEWDRRFSNRRARAVNRFWAEERARLRSGQSGTRNWSDQQADAIRNGRTPYFDGKAVTGHHRYNAVNYPHLADNPRFIYPATYNEHLYRWHGGNWQFDTSGLPNNSRFREEF